MLVAASVIAGFALFASLVALWYALSSARGVALTAPSALLDRQKVLESGQTALKRLVDAAVIDLGTRVDSADAKMISWRTDIEALFESVEDLMDRTERKRRSATQAARRAGNGGADTAEQQDPLQMDLTALRARARQLGIDVM